MRRATINAIPAWVFQVWKRHYHYINADRAERAAWEFLLEVVSQRDKLYLRLKEAQANVLEKVFPQRDQLESVKAMLAEAEVDAERTAREMRGIPESRRSGPTYMALEKQGQRLTNAMPV